MRFNHDVGHPVQVWAAGRMDASSRYIDDTTSPELGEHL
jgi:hypothetical protein